MDIRPQFSLVAAALLALALAACSSDSSPTGGGTTDTTPPGVTAVTPVDAYHVDVTFNEQVTKSSAEDESHYVLTPVAPPVAPASSAMGVLGVADATLKNDKKTVTLTTNSSMSGLNFDLGITGVSDTHGNDITETVSKPFTGSNDPDVTAPQIIEKSPAAGATNAPIGTPVTIKFSELLNNTTFTSGVSWTSGAGPVDFSISHDGTQYTLTPSAALGYNQLQTISLTGVQDPSGNTLVDTEWSFTTTNTADHTPPTIVSTTPANLATNVDVNANLSFTFSEPVTIEQDGISTVPDLGDGTPTWSNGGKTLTFDPANPLLSNQQYSVIVNPNGVKDLSGNGIVGVHAYVFTTGSTLASGSIAGTISGDPGSAAADPTGATVVAVDGTPFAGAFNILGSATVAGNDTYSIQHLADGDYYLISVLDTNHDGNIDPSNGDAVGSYGVDFANMDFSPDSVVISGGTHATNVNFKLYDPSVITGSVAYDGVHNEGHSVYIGIFATAGFDPATSSPLAYTEAYWPGYPEWGVNTLDTPLPAGNYYVAAYLDVNDNTDYDPATDAAGVYGGLATPTAVHIANGNDISGIVVLMADPAPAVTATSHVDWSSARHGTQYQHLFKAVKEADLHASR